MNRESWSREALKTSWTCALRADSRGFFFGGGGFPRGQSIQVDGPGCTIVPLTRTTQAVAHFWLRVVAPSHHLEHHGGRGV